MVYVCSVCRYNAPDIPALCTHIRISHPLNVLGSFDCGQCPRKYSSLKNLREHLKNKHPHEDAEGDRPEDPDDPPPNHGNNEVEDMEVGEQGEGGDHNNGAGLEDLPNVTVIDFKTAMFESALGLCAKLYSVKSFNRSQVQDIIDIVSDFTSSGFIDVLKAKVLRVVGVENDEVEEIKEMFSSIQNSFEGLQTEKQRMNALENSDSFVRPQSYFIGQSEVVKYVDGNPVLTPIELTGQFISMKKVLKQFFQLPGVYRDTLQNIENLRASTDYNNIIQSPFWQNIERTHFQNRTVFPLFLYYDDADPDSMGSHSGSHKLGLVYYQIPCIPQHLLSMLTYIFMAAVFLYTDRAQYPEAAFQPILNELIDLERNGIQIQVDGFVYTIYFALALILGDNLGLNSILGFVESFRANYFCRLCKAHRNLTMQLQRQRQDLMRDIHNYMEDVQINDYSLTGIKRESMWNILVAFHAAVNFVVDLMHDFLEGVCHYDLAVVLLELIRNNFITLDRLNERFQNYDYGFDSGKKPVLITMEHLRNERFKMSASEMLFFVRHLGLMIGDLIPDNNEYWKLYLYLSEILDILTAPSVDRNRTAYLETIIAEHHEIYCNVFNKTLKPKFHFMLHYPFILNLLGPVVHFWAMRFEGKHRPVAKISAKSHTCRKNMPMTTAKRYALSLCAQMLAKRGFPEDTVFHEHEENMSDLENFEEFRPFLPDELNNDYHIVPVVKQATIRGTLYKRNMVVAIGFENNLPLFGKIKCIIKPFEHIERALFVLSGLETVGFYEHYHAYLVRQSAEWFVKEQGDFVSFHPSQCRNGGDGSTFVTFKHVL